MQGMHRTTIEVELHLNAKQARLQEKEIPGRVVCIFRKFIVERTVYLLLFSFFALLNKIQWKINKKNWQNGVSLFFEYCKSNKSFLILLNKIANEIQWKVNEK